VSENKNTSYDSAIGWMIILAVFICLMWLVWYFKQAEIRDLIRWIRYGQMWLISWFVDDDYTVVFNGEQVNWQQGFEQTAAWDKNAMRIQHMSYMTSLAMQPLKWIFVVISALAAFWALTKGPGTDFRQSLNITSLIGRQAYNFPVIAPFVKFNPSDVPPRPPGAPVPADLPAFAEALGPEEWVAYNQIPIPDGKISGQAVHKALTKQLCGRWRGIKALKPYHQVLLAAFCLKASRKREAADTMLGRLALCWSHDKGLQLGKDKTLLKEARKILSNKKLAQITLSNANKHAFVTTAMLRALQTARDEGGVLAPAQFVWLRAYDRTLWYPLNNLGRRANHTEAIGAMAHYRAEKLTDRPIPVPKVEDATKTIIEYFDSTKKRPIPKLDYSNSKKRGIKKAT
jgi:intracellular multiplication protein IcmP